MRTREKSNKTLVQNHQMIQSWVKLKCSLITNQLNQSVDEMLAICSGFSVKILDVSNFKLCHWMEPRVSTLKKRYYFEQGSQWLFIRSGALLVKVELTFRCQAQRAVPAGHQENHKEIRSCIVLPCTMSCWAISEMTRVLSVNHERGVTLRYVKHLFSL